MTEDIHDPAFVAGVFDRCAGTYRRWAAISSFGFVTRWRRACVDAMPPETPETAVVLDLMAGTGELWPVYLKRYPHTERIIAVDISHQMHLRAVDLLHKSRAERIEHIEADFLANDLPDAFADCVISSFGLKTLDTTQQATFAREVARILKPGGTVSLIEASDPKGWILRPLYRLYLDRVLPVIERLFLRGAQDFSMIGIYTRTFGDCSHILDCLTREGLQVSKRRYFFGCATGVSGVKPL